MDGRSVASFSSLEGDDLAPLKPEPAKVFPQSIGIIGLCLGLARYSEQSAAEHLADQLLVPMALAGGGSFTTPRMTEHLHSNIAVIELFLPVRIDCREEGTDRLRVEVSAN